MNTVYPKLKAPLLFALCSLCLLMAEPLSCHEVRPALLQITERPNGHYDVLWKQPTIGEVAVHLEPLISGGLLEGEPNVIQRGEDFRLRVWRDLDAGPEGLDGRKLRIVGLDRTITNVLVAVALNSGSESQQLVGPENPTLMLRIRGSHITVPAFSMLGVKHILTGVDHLLFVLGLMLLVRCRRRLVTTITAFTVAHSITLAATALHIIAACVPTIEVLVVLSIVFVASEVVHSYRGKAGVSARHPWLIAFMFGLIHGSAFASGLAQVGLPPGAVVLSLLLFNFGVEVGQLLFIAALLVVEWALTRWPRRLPEWTRWIPPYACGSLATFWVVERLGAAIN
jgi:hydrogenase/urease accessory protein HupE